MTCRPFISYAKEDRAVAERLYQDLRRLGAEPWLDVHRLRGGDAWKDAIRQALSESTHVLTLISASSVTKTGFVQNEVRQALELLENVPPGQLFIVPVRIDDATPRHSRLSELHWIDLFPDYHAGLQRIVESLDLELQSPKGPSKTPRRAAVIALFLSAVFGLLLINGNLLRRMTEPNVITNNAFLAPDGHRGSSAAIPVSVPAEANVLLRLILTEHARFADYRIELFDINTAETRLIWSSVGVKIDWDNTFIVAIPNSYLQAGRYRLVVAGLEGERAIPLASYSLKAAQ